MYQPESHRGLYIVLVLAFASAIAWLFIFYYKPILVEASCSDIASSSSNLFSKKQNLLDPNYDYDYLKARCLEDAKFAKAIK